MKNNRFEDNLIVENIIVNKNKNRKTSVPYIATEKWIKQLGQRLLINELIN